ncbi:uncharacterized protein EI97DRAFT_458326 [Westerdykella ornata]|uniref:MARVEL domain-containing protein n=1 Tax=Westerdykella ornata TaxID=318751 RepID=A0A6A6JIB5_WESOR|nr:uncharacterized protein EI97DRAFT_458326 [Westerdykella ornata]KAF2276390.1 hypothetical protein EI97DRAFT_458326 [Westerdykella ornata]
MARVHATNDYGTAAAPRSNKLHRPLILANHFLHWSSSVIVMSISAYFVAKFSHNTHLIYWLTIAAIDTLLYLPALFLPAMRSYKGYFAPAAWVFSYLWLTAYIFAAQDYNFGRCAYLSPAFVNKCSMKQTIQAFTFIAFFTNLVGQILEGRLWDRQRFKGTHALDADKTHATAPATATTTTTAPTTAV